MHHSRWPAPSTKATEGDGKIVVSIFSRKWEKETLNTCINWNDHGYTLESIVHNALKIRLMLHKPRIARILSLSLPQHVTNCFTANVAHHHSEAELAVSRKKKLAWSSENAHHGRATNKTKRSDSNLRKRESDWAGSWIELLLDRLLIFGAS